MQFWVTIIALCMLTSPSVLAADCSTPQGALQALEQAYRAHNTEAAVAAKNFTYEARAMLKNLKSTPNPDAGLVQEVAHVLELSFRKHLKEDGFPDMDGVHTKIVTTKQLAPDLVEMAEQVSYSDGYVSRETVYAALSGKGWGMVNLPGK